MQNQAAVEALYSATFVEDYLDCVENLPNDLQRHLSRLREFDLIQYNEFLKDLDDLVQAFEKETTASGQRSILAKIQHGLIAAQDIGDDKLVTVQAMSDLIENKSRQLEHDSKILDFGKDDEEDGGQIVGGGGGVIGTSSSKTSQNNANNQTSSNVTSTKANQGSGSGNKSSKAEKAEKEGGKPPIKRRKKQQQPSADNTTTSKSRGGGAGASAAAGGDDREDDEVSNVSNRSGGGSRSRGSMGGNKRGGGAGAAGQQMAKKTSRGKRPANYEKDNDSDKEVDLSNIEIDPDEPTYCLCDQVSYGEMIGCDNDLCPIEWFHFNCVQLSCKPKGKWYCPKCRGDKQTVMKPRAQFLKELAIFNKEREAKMMTK